MLCCAESCPTLCNPLDCSPPGSSVHDSQARILEWVAMPSLRGSSWPRDWTQVSHTAGGFFMSEPPGKPKNTGVDSLTLLQETFLTQEWNLSLLLCRQILYQLSNRGNPKKELHSIISNFLRVNFFVAKMSNADLHLPLLSKSSLASVDVISV